MPAAMRPADAHPPPLPTDTAPAARPSPATGAAWALSTWDVLPPGPAPRPAARREDGADPEVEAMLRLALHDLRNSLAAIQLGVELLGRREGAGQSPSTPVLAHIDNAAQRAHALTVELDDLTRLATRRPLAVAPAAFSLHAVARDALDASRCIVPGVRVEHDRLGDGDCVGDAARMAQFLALALEDLCADTPPASVIVISEVAGERFRMAVHAGGLLGAATAGHDPATHPTRAQARRRLLMQAIARAHGGAVRFEGGYATQGQAGRSIDGSFSRLAHPPATPEQERP